MEDRETLKELLKKMLLSKEEMTYEEMADYLLQRVALKPKCKVGDTVYCVYRYSDFMGNCDDAKITVSTVGGFIFDDGKIKPIPLDYPDQRDHWYRLLDICMTMGEAEKSLEECNR